jgi:branched-chain amino acid transport system substrate-binding protein
MGAHALGTIAKGSAKNGAAVAATLRATGAFDDPLFGKTTVRRDGRVVHDMYLSMRATQPN